MGFAFHLTLYDKEQIARSGKPGEAAFSFAHMTVAQAQSALTYLESMARRLERFIEDNQENPPTEDSDMGMVKHGSGEIIEQDDQKTAAAKPEFTDDDKQALAAENADVDAGERTEG